jgi:UDP-N-acetylglucosamine 4,6-dehydratase
VLNHKTVLITGGTGSFGKRCTGAILKRFPNIKRLIIYSRDEYKQYLMAQEFTDADYPCMRYFIGDIRDKERLHRAFSDVDYVIHTAALKQVPAAEYNPFEAVKTNIIGSQNVINCAIEQGVRKVIALSTDKAANPINLYGATKLCSDKLFVAGNSLAGRDGARFSVVRYGNVVGSRGSVIPFFLEKKKQGNPLPVTDPRMTRFWITLDQGVAFVLSCLGAMSGGEVFVPKIPSMNIMDLANAIWEDAPIENVGIRPGEKLHEIMIAQDDARNTIEFDAHYIIKPSYCFRECRIDESGGRPVDEGFEYNSGTNTWWLTVKELREMIGTV